MNADGVIIIPYRNKEVDMDHKTYQIRHKELGLFQGMFIGMGFWLGISKIPEEGIHEFPDKDSAICLIDSLCGNGANPPMYREDLTIEEFDYSLDYELYTGEKRVFEARDDYIDAINAFHLRLVNN